MNQRNCPVHLPLRSVAQCCSSQYFAQDFELLSDGKSAHRWFSPRSPRRPRRSPVQRADRPRPRHVLHSRSRWPSADWGPRATGRHGSQTIAASGHCHLPRDDQLPAPRGGDQRARESNMCFVVHLHRASFYNYPVGKLAMQYGDNGRLAQPD